MTVRLVDEVDGAQVYHAPWRALLEVVPVCDALIVDAPYSQRTHAGHDDGIAQANRLANYVDGAARRRPPRGATNRPRRALWDVKLAAKKAAAGVAHRRTLAYSAWTAVDVAAFVGEWAPRTTGWFVSITDHVLAPAWEAALVAAGRYVFAPLPYVAPGSRVRMTGDGPAIWSNSIVVARPKSREMASWGALPGAYVLPAGQHADLPVVGGKPPWLLQRLVEDYSRPGDLVVDPTCGAGTTAIGALRSGRRAIVGDLDATHAELAALWIKHPHRPAPHVEREDTGPQRSLFGAA